MLDLGAARELVPHLAGALHEVLVLHLHEPALFQARQSASLRSLLLRISLGRLVFLDNLHHGLVLERTFPELGRLVVR